MDDGTAAIGFTACADGERNYEINEIVLFDLELTNYGGYYSTHASSFICPVDGIYIFTLVINVDDTNALVFIMRNNLDLTDTWAEASEIRYNHGTNMVVTECLAGDVVWPRVGWILGSKDIHAGSGCYTTFSGVLIKA